jgi:hypothetical protein
MVFSLKSAKPGAADGHGIGIGNMAKTEGGEAFLAECRPTGKIRHLPGLPPWYALWTHSHCEQLVHDQLAVRGFEVFLPKLAIWSRRAGAKHRILRPMFPGYLFVRDELSEARYAELLGARGLVCVLGNE